MADKTGTTLFSANATSRSVSVVDIGSGAVTGTIELHGNPNGLAMSPDGMFLFVASGSAEGEIEIVDIEKKAVVRTIPAGHTPCAPVAGPGRQDGICLQQVRQQCHGHRSYPETKNRFAIPMLREPVAADITPDGTRLFVANHLPSGRIIYDYVKDAQTLMIGSYMSSSTYGGRENGLCRSGGRIRRGNRNPTGWLN